MYPAMARKLLLAAVMVVAGLMLAGYRLQDLRQWILGYSGEAVQATSGSGEIDGWGR